MGRSSNHAITDRKGKELMNDFTVLQDPEEIKLIEKFRKEKQFPEYQYLNIARNILDVGALVKNRTGISAYTIPHASMSFDLSNGFPLFTHKKVAWKTMKVELEAFIKGIKSKKWLKDRGCNIWNEWCNPKKVPYGHDPETKKKMLEEDDLGEIYGRQWIDFNNQGINQLKIIVDTLKNNPNDRRMVCSAWNPVEMYHPERGSLALPPCHFNFVLSHINGTLNLSYEMRSVDWGLGVSFNTGSYALLLHLFCKEANMKEGVVTGFFNNVHIYENHKKCFEDIIFKRELFQFPKIETEKFTSIFDWTYEDTKVIDYKSGSSVPMEIAV